MPLFLFGFAVASALGATTLVLRSLLKRPNAPLTEEDVRGKVKEPSISLAQSLNKNERETIKDAFMTGTDFVWVAGGKSSSEEGHRLCNDYMIECVMRFAALYGDIVVARDPKDDSFQGAICLVSSYRSLAHFKFHFMRAIIGLGEPPMRKLGQMDRLDAYGDATMSAHKEVMGTIPHIYVMNLGVAPKAQGKGVGRSLMNAAKQIAGDRPLYLECHDGNVKIYEKMGYQLAKGYDIVPQGNPKDVYHYNGMTYGMQHNQ